MTGLDTNVVISLLFDAEEKELPVAPPYFLSWIVLAEISWVLASRFKAGRDRIAQTIEGLMSLQGFSVERSQIVQTALEDYRAGPADFADYLILHGNADAGCRTTLTHDRKAARTPGFTLMT